MPAIAKFYGLIVYMYFRDNRQHHLPHIHVKYQDDEVILALPDGSVLDGEIPMTKLKLVQAWIEIHEIELMNNWDRASQGQLPHKIAPLR